MGQNINVSVTGGYNGGAVINITLDGNNVFTSTGNSPYNLVYSVTTGSFNSEVGNINVLVTPPPNNQGVLYIDLSDNVSIHCAVNHLGANTSYGYNYSATYPIGEQPDPAESVNVYFTELGQFSVIKNSILYNSVVDYSSAMEFIPWSAIHATALFNAEPQANTLNTMYEKAPLTQIKQVQASDYTNYSIRNNSGKSVYAQIRVIEDGSVLVNQSFNPGNISFSNFPYGIFYRGPSQSSITDGNISVLLADSTFTAFKVVTLSFDEDDYGIYISEVTSQETITKLNIYLSTMTPSYKDGSPYAAGGNSEVGGGNGDFSDPGDNIQDETIPDVSAVDTGFITLFKPSISQLNSLASYMWTGAFDINNFKKIFANPMDCILGLSMLPKIVESGGSGTVMVGNISTGISMTKAANQFVKFDCGDLKIKRYSNSFLDYAPYTKIKLYLPFIGLKDLNTDKVMNKTINIKYTIDILSGACVALIIVDGTTLNTFIGQCSASIPITGNDWTNMLNGVLSIAGSALRGAMGGGLAGGLIGGGASLASNISQMKEDIETNGNTSGMAGIMCIKTPFVIIERPAQAIPANQNTVIGLPSCVYCNLGELNGFNVIDKIHLENIQATQEELTEIENLLKDGVIL